MSQKEQQVQSDPPLVCRSLIEKTRFALDPINYLLRYGTRVDVTRMQLPVYGVGTTEYVVVSEPTLANNVLHDAETFEQYSDIRHSMPFQNPLSSPQDDGIDWMEKRNAYVDAFSGDSYRNAIAAAERQVATDVAALPTGRWHDTATLMRRLTMRMTAAILFGQTPPDEIEEYIQTAASHAVNVTNLGLSSFLPVWTPRMSLLGFWMKRDPIGNWVDDAIEAAPDDALIWEIVDALDVAVDDDLKGVALFPLVAGFVSTEVMLSVCFDLLGSTTREQTKLERATATLPPAPTNRDLVDCRNALRWPLLESLRLYPPTYFVTRRATERTTLDGYVVAEGDFVWIDQWSIGRHPDHWDAPNKFSPARWERMSPRRDAFLPFGAGERDCLGKDLSLLYGELLLGSLFRAYDIDVRTSGITPETVRGGMTLQFDPPMIKLRQ